ncbi:hypothetical protein [Paenibacillus ehimensis]|uniref:hypothetical protein n=1 Tax=Paenibacillus ehimensis TaxID=79264 RepID=UPI000FDA432B|nr:hypothetical protein [Paenibacillus ehimensis]
MLVIAGDLNLWVVDNEHFAFQRKKPDRNGLTIEFSPFFKDGRVLASVTEFSEYLAKAKKKHQLFGPNGMLINFREGLYIWAMEQNLVIPFCEVVVRS